MDYSMVAPKTCVLKVHIHCPACERKVKKLLQKINGVYSIGIDAEQGKVTVSGTVDPHTLIMMLGKAGKNAELLWEHSPPMTNHNHNTQIVQPQPVQCTDQHMGGQMAPLHQLSQMKRLKQVELTHSKSVKMTFNGHKDDLILSHKDDTHSTKIIMDDVHGRQKHHGCAAAAAPCCGGCCGHVMDQVHHGCHEVDVTCRAGPSRTSGQHECCNGRVPPPECRCTPLGPPPAPSHWVSGPPLDSPPVAFPYPSIFSDDNPHSCSLM